jgi:acid phosphatase
MRARLAVVVALVCVLLVACDDEKPSVIREPQPAPAPSTIETPTPAAETEQPLDFPSVSTGVDKVLVMVVENKSFAQMKAQAPKIWALAQQYAYATNFKAIVHPSLPNYIAMAAGSLLGVGSNGYPSSIKVKGPSVFGNTIKAGGTAKIWADSMGSETCKPKDSGKYAPRHVPWNDFVDERQLCQKFVVDGGQFAGDVAAGNLATVGMFIPDNCHNAHDCSIGTADNWISSQVEVAMSGPDWKSGSLAIVVTADEDNKKAGNRILTVVIHPSQSHKVVTTPLSLYSLHRLLADVGNTQPMNKGATAPDMAKAFGLPVS